MTSQMKCGSENEYFKAIIRDEIIVGYEKYKLQVNIEMLKHTLSPQRDVTSSFSP